MVTVGDYLFLRPEDVRERITTCEYVKVVATVFLVGAVLACVYIAIMCPQEALEPDVYVAPLVPFLPTIAIIADFYMMAQISALGLKLSLAWVAAAIVSYFVYGYGNAAGRTGWSALLHYLPHLSANQDPDRRSGDKFSGSHEMISPVGKARL